MRYTSAALLVACVFAPLATADLHSNGICSDKVGGVSVYNSAATDAACTAYKNRNTGDNQWDTCPDCTMVEVSGFKVCNSAAKHIGGDELEYYCKENGAGGSLAD